jgi:hypothetical protein
MRRVLVAVLVSLVTLGIAPVVAQTAAAVTPTQLISVAGNGAAIFPAFAAGTLRYGLTTTDATAGTVTVTGSTTDPSGRVWVDGRPAVNGSETLTGLTSGDEISVFIKDSAGTTAYSLIYLPAGFPTLTVATKQPGIAPGDVFLTLSDFTNLTPSYETVVDSNGVPIFVHTDAKTPTDFKLQPNGDFSVNRDSPTTGRTGGEIVELNDQFKQVAAFETTGLVDTDGHDSILLPNGDRWLLAYEPNSNGNVDGVIQKTNAAGKVLFQWSTADDPNVESMVTASDYAHLNSISLTADGDIVVSFRQLSQVMRIATSTHDGYKKCDVIWTLGGRNPTLTTVNDPNDGPCGQHDATVLPNGHILMYDDGSQQINTSPPVCVDPSDPSGPAISRPQSRVVEYSISAAKHTATLVWSYQVDGRNSSFGGSAQRLANGNTLIGWGGTVQALATEVNAAQQTLWQLKDSDNLFSYRALKFAAPDAVPPVIDLSQPAKGADYSVGQSVTSDFSCTDRGGSNLQSCAGPAVEGAPIDTSTPGIHTFTVVAKDGAGNTTTVSRTYHVGRYQPDALIKKLPKGHYVGGNVYGPIASQQIKESIARSGKSALARARLQNDGTVADRLSIKGSAGTAKFRISYFAGGRNVTSKVTAGTYKTPSLAPGASFTLRVKVTRTTAANVGNSKTVKVAARSLNQPSRHDAVATIVRAIH